MSPPAAPFAVAPAATASGAADQALATWEQGVDAMFAALTGGLGSTSDPTTDGTAPLSLGRARELLTRVERLGRRTDALRLRLVHAAGRAGLPEQAGFTDAGAWTSRHTGQDRHHAASDATLAGALGAGAPADPPTRPTTDPAPDPDAPTVDADPASASTVAATPTTGVIPRTPTGVALDSGDISLAHAKVITRALDQLPGTVAPADRARCEAELLTAARTLTPARLRRAARRVLAHVEPDPQVVDAHEDRLLTAEEDAAHERAAFWLKDNHDGTMTGHFTVPWLAGTQLRKVIDAMTAPRRRTGPGAPVGAERDEAGWRERQLDWQHRRGLALTELLGHLPTDHLHDKAAATVLVTIPLATLAGEQPGTGRTDTGDHISAGQARHTACQAGIIPTVLAGDALPLDLGRQRRLFTPAQRAALATTYDTCAADGCDRPFAWSEIHHLRPWQHGGTTDLGNAVPLCHTHHRWVDRTDLEHRVHRHRDGRATITFGRPARSHQLDEPLPRAG